MFELLVGILVCALVSVAVWGRASRGDRRIWEHN